MARNRTITNPANNSSRSSAVVRSELQTLENNMICGPSIFGVFGGDGNQGAISVTTNTNLSDIDDANKPGIIQCTSFNLTSGDTLTVDTGWLFLGCTGTVTIDGIIDANGKGEAASRGMYAGVPSGACFDKSSIDQVYFTSYQSSATASTNQHAITLGWVSNPVPFSVAGAGGAGGLYSGGNAEFPRMNFPGGGAGGRGGIQGSPSSGTYVGANATATASAKLIALTGGLGDNSATTRGYSQFNPMILIGRGASGASGNPSTDTSGYGGSGGGNIYIECNELVFTGTLRANGDNGTGHPSGAGCGGGGGGVILVRAKTVTTNSGAVTVTGGTGSSGNGGGGTGGNGADGFKQIIQLLG